MWDEAVLKTLADKSNGTGCSKQEQHLLNEYMSFYASNEYGDHYCLGYTTLLDYYTGKKHNPFIWIGYILYSERGYKTVYRKDDK